MLATLLSALVTLNSTAAPALAAGAVAAGATAGAPTACIAEGGGELRARLRGAVDLDLAWNNAEMLCDGGSRPDGSGLRVSIAGPDRGNGKRLRFVFGIAGVREGVDAQQRPTNVTLIFDGEQRIFGTRGDQNCVTDELHQQRLGTPGSHERRWRITARGFCLGPAATLTQDARILVSRFDFTTQVQFHDDPVHDGPVHDDQAISPVRPADPADHR